MGGLNGRLMGHVLWALCVPFCHILTDQSRYVMISVLHTPVSIIDSAMPHFVCSPFIPPWKEYGAHTRGMEHMPILEWGLLCWF